MQSRCSNLLEAYQEEQKRFVRETADFEYKQKQRQDALETLDAFAKTMSVEWSGMNFDCGLNRSQMPCSLLASGAHEKCACQKKFGGRAHLYAPCQTTASLLSPELSFDRCAARGHLDNNLPHLSKARQVISETDSLQRPTLRFPSNTCGPCKSEFQKLETDFTYEQLNRTKQCIKAIQSSPQRAPTKTSPIEEEEENEDFELPPNQRVAGATMPFPVPMTTPQKSAWWHIPVALVLMAVIAFALYYILFKTPVAQVSGKSLLKCAWTE